MFDRYLHGYGTRTFPPTGPLKQSGSRYKTQAFPRLKERPPSKVAGNSQQPRRAVPKRPPQERAAGRLEPTWLRLISLSLYPSLSLSLFLCLSVSFHFTSLRGSLLCLGSEPGAVLPTRAQGASPSTLLAERARLYRVVTRTERRERSGVSLSLPVSPRFRLPCQQIAVAPAQLQPIAGIPCTSKQFHVASEMNL